MFVTPAAVMLLVIPATPRDLARHLPSFLIVIAQRRAAAATVLAVVESPPIAGRARRAALRDGPRRLDAAELSPLAADVRKLF